MVNGTSSTDEHTIIYVMRHIDIGGNIEIPYKKIGVTGKGSSTITSRLQQISNTKSPIKAQCVKAWTHDKAKDVETALHSLLDDSRVEGEWFLDKDDTLIERMEEIMNLLGAIEKEIEIVDDSYTQQVLKKESETKSAEHESLVGALSGLLKEPLRTSVRKIGPTFFSDKTNFTYYINSRKSGKHKLAVGRSKTIYNELSNFLEIKDFNVEQEKRGDACVHGLSVESIAEMINVIESEFNATRGVGNE